MRLFLFYSLFKCPIVILDDIIHPPSQETVVIHPGFRYKEMFNRFFIKMRTTGVISRIYKKHETSDDPELYESTHTYNVAKQGVMFMQIQYFLILLACAFAFGFVVLAFELIFYKLGKP